MSSQTLPIEEQQSSADAASTAVPSAPTDKKVGALVLDSGGLIKNEIAISTLLSQAEELYTTPAVIAELKDAATRARIQPLMPFLKLRNPRPDSSKFISDFARKTGDLSVLSRVDLQLLALTYELEKEKNKGDWRLRNDPTQKTLNGKPPGKEEAEQAGEAAGAEQDATSDTPKEVSQSENVVAQEILSTGNEDKQASEENTTLEAQNVDMTQDDDLSATADKVQNISLDTVPTGEDIEASSAIPPASEVEQPEEQDPVEEAQDNDSDGEWITPTNLDKHRKKDKNLGVPQPIEQMLQVAILTTDNAMRNVALRINLNLLDPSFARVTYIKTWVLRCHTCMKICKEQQKQFCPSCGHPTLTRVSVSTDADNNFTVHLKRNFQWNNRGNVYSIPKPTHGTSSGKTAKVQGGGKGGWGQELILAEDQKEYAKQVEGQRRSRAKDLMDEDYLPSLLTGEGKSHNSRVKVGAGRNVNAKKRH